MKTRAVLIISIFLLFQAAAVFGAGRQPTTDSIQPVEDRSAERRSMVSDQLKSRDIRDPAVLSAMARVPRHLFIPDEYRHLAYADRPVLIGEGQTISQPYIVALMTQLLELEETDRILEIGTGSGYQAAVLAETAGEVFSVEIKPVLYERAAETLTTVGYDSVHLLSGDGYFGWEEHAPFDGIMITAAANHVPPPLLDQLKPDGVLVMPLGDPLGYQLLIRVTRTDDDYILEQITGVMFVPMTGTAMNSEVR